LMFSRLDLTPRKVAATLDRLIGDVSFRENMLRLKRIQDPVDGAAVRCHAGKPRSGLRPRIGAAE